MSKDSGGYAFPVPNDADNNGNCGMTLRDYFAGQAMAAIANGCIIASKKLSDEECAEASYQLADAMIKARENG